MAESGNSRESTRASLEAIRAECLEVAAQIQSLRLRGEIQPGNREFLYVQRETQRRFELEHDQPTGRIRCFRLDDGTNLFKLDEKALSLDSGTDLDKKWRSLCNEISSFESPLFEGSQRDLAGWTQWFIQILDGDPAVAELTEGLRTGVVSISATREGSLTTIALSSTAYRRNPLLALQVDHDKRCALVGWELRDGADDPAQWEYDLTVKNEFSESVPGIWIIQRGRITKRDRGWAAAKSGRPELQEWSIEIHSAEVGDFPVPDQFFSPHSLPIAPGTHVQDYRVEPTAYFTYGGLSVNDEVLDKALEDRGPVPRGWSGNLWGVVALNVLAIGILFLAFRPRRGTRP